MNFRQLHYVVEVSRCGSINKAAQKLFLSQSAISTAIKELEEELDIQLFDRTSRGVTFTQEGREFLGYATSLCEQKEHIENLYRGHSRSAPHHFSVSTQRYPFTEDAFIKLLAQTEAPRFHYSIKAVGMHSVIEDVYDHRSDLGVIYLTRSNEKMIRHLLHIKNLEFNLITEIPPCVFVRPGHPLAAKTEVAAEDLSEYVYLSFEHGQSVPLEFSEEFHLLSFQTPSRMIRVNDRATAVNIIARSDAITTGSGLLVESADTRMISIPLSSDDTMQLGWIKDKSARLTDNAQAFVELLEQSIADAIAYTRKLHHSHTGILSENSNT